jgi:hypothetical protein
MFNLHKKISLRTEKKKFLIKMLNTRMLSFFFFYHLNNNFLFILTKKMFLLKSHFYSLITYLIRKSKLKQKNQPLKKGHVDLKYCLFKSKWLNLINYLEPRKIIGIENRGYRFANRNIKRHLNFFKKKKILLKKFKKFYRYYLGIVFRTFHNIFIWKILNTKQRSGLKKIFIILIRTQKKFYFIVKILKKKKKMNFIKKKLEKKNSLSRAILMAKNSISTNN